MVQIVYRLAGYPGEPVPVDADHHVRAWAEYPRRRAGRPGRFVPDDMPPDRIREVLRSFLAVVPPLAAAGIT
ncbi:hypothetical protein [Jiangella asiatica]|uniref:Uncharacterized protein n=1 Tax=Jiangella asiatica TaxID=2530372 RepID=A0A4R5DLV3_9ACTN|nr:hypothetical protein [Jiangella asiatica]TDE12961.1 hypothetical protein E1269_06055 [Jiangella asiatica]